ncbi:hypothetical protein Tco_0676823 [Tanacetum coccineum]
MPTKVELTLEQSQQGVSDDVLNIRVILFSIHSDDGNPSSVIIKQHCGTNVNVAVSFQLSRIHYHMLILKALKVKHSASRLLLLNKNVFSQKAQANVIILFCNSNRHEFPQWHQRSSKLNKIGEIVSLMKKRRLGAFKTSMSMSVKSTS